MPMQDPIWTPSPERVAASRLRQFMERVDASDFADLHRWSVNCPEESGKLFGPLSGSGPAANRCESWMTAAKCPGRAGSLEPS